MTTNKQPKEIALLMADSVMCRYKPEQVLWHYEHGLVLQSVYAAGRAFGEKRYFDWVKMMYDTKITTDGVIQTYRQSEFNLDQINMGKHLFDLYAETGEEKYKKALFTLRAQLAVHPRTVSGGFWHKQIYPYQMWLDGLYMQAPFYARFAAVFENEEESRSSFNDIAAQLLLLYEKSRDPVSGLLYHAWDESKEQKWADAKTGCSPHFWGRALGWYCMAVTDVLDYLPETHEKRPALVEIIRSLVSAIQAVQDKNGLWFQILNLPKEPGNYLETSASSMFLYFFAKTLHMGLLDKTQSAGALSCVRNAYAAVVRDKLSAEKKDGGFEYHLNDICSVAGLGGTPYRDGSFKYYVQEPVVSDDFKGVGPFILALLEVQKLHDAD